MGALAYIMPSISGVPNTLKWGIKLQLAHKWADWLHHPHYLGGHQRFIAGNKIRGAPSMGGLATSPLPLGGPQRCKAGDKIKKGP